MVENASLRQELQALQAVVAQQQAHSTHSALSAQVPSPQGPPVVRPPVFYVHFVQ